MFGLKLMLCVFFFCMGLSGFVVEVQQANYLLASIDMAAASFWLWMLITLGRD